MRKKVCQAFFVHFLSFGDSDISRRTPQHFFIYFSQNRPARFALKSNTPSRAHLISVVHRSMSSRKNKRFKTFQKSEKNQDNDGINQNNRL